MKTLLQSIAQMEGFYVEGTRPQRNNNPGDIEFGEFATAHGATHAEQPEGRFAFFPDVSTGFLAMEELLKEHYAGLTLRQMVFKWAPPNENNSEAYLEAVSEMSGIEENEVIDGFLSYTPE